ncbi:MAG: hypothetical protein AB1796_14225 [Bacillota bacterium]
MVDIDCKGFFPRETEALLYRLGYQAEIGFCRAYLVGGFVSDLLLGRENRNLNLLVEGDVPAYARRLQRSLPGKAQWCDILRTATVHLPGSFIIKISTLKTDLNILSGEEPNTTVSLKNELYQRDFTINTMALVLNPENFCRLHDFFDGVKDLDKGTIRVLYSLSFVDDPLRLLRALRMERRYGFNIDGETSRLMSAAIAGRVLHKVSREGITRELRLIFNEPKPSRVLLRLHELGLWQQVFPRLSYNKAILVRLQGLEQMYASLLLAEKRPFRYNTFIIYLCALLYGLSRHDSQYLAHVLRLKRGEREEMMKILDSVTSVPEKNAGNGDNENGLINWLINKCTGEKGAKQENVS